MGYYMAPLSWVLQPPTVANFLSEFRLFLVIGIGAAILTIGWLVYAAIKYRVKEEQRVEEIRPSGKNDNVRAWLTALVTIWILIAVLVTSHQATTFLYNAPSTNVLVIRVYGFQWGWNFTYPNGYWELGVLHVPANTTIILNVTSKDVFHTLGIPMFYVKADAIPGQWTSLWFVATQTGDYPYAIKCYELCGNGHYSMVANLTVMSQAQFEQWYQSVSKH